MNDKNNASDKQINQEYAKYYLKEAERRVDLIYNADIMNPEAVKMWEAVKNETWIKPEIREKWEKALKNKKN